MIKKFTNSKLIGGLLFSLLLLASSCGSPKRYAYMQDVETAKLYSVQHQNVLKIKPGDRIRVSIQSAYPELLSPFIGQGFQSVIPTATGASSAGASTQEAKEIRSYGYSVDATGQVNLPVIGYLKLGDLTLADAAKVIEEKLKTTKYIVDPRVEVLFSNFSIYLLGALNHVKTSVTNSAATTFSAMNGVRGGILSVEDKSELNILEALSYIGDLPINANIEKVFVIRRVNGQFTTYKMNLKSVDIYNSPAFYLQQNDILYVEPRYKRSENEGIERVLQYVSYGLTSVTAVVTAIALLRR